MEETRRDSFVVAKKFLSFLLFFPSISQLYLSQYNNTNNNTTSTLRKREKKKREYAKLVSVKNGNFMPLCKLVSI